MLQYSDFNACLIYKFLLVSNYFDCDHGFSFVVEAFDALAETSFPEKVDYFEPERNMILLHDFVITSFVV